MKKIENLRSQFGLTQNELALLLYVSRSQLSMYELGVRDLPVFAKEQLAQMLLYVQKKPFKATINKALLKEQEEQKQKVLHDLLIVNKHQQLLLEKKINILERKQLNNLKSLHLVAFLEKQDANKSDVGIPVFKMLERKALSEMTKRGLTTLTKLELKKEVLVAEEQLLKKFCKS